MTFNKTHTATRGTATYRSPEGLVLYAPKSVGEQPDVIEVKGLVALPKTSKAKLTPEEKKANAAAKRAANAGLTPAQKLEREEANIAKRAAAVAAKKAKLMAEAAA